MGGSLEGDDIDARIDEALQCPCVADLREGPCGTSFSGAFRCFIKSEHPDKGMDCIPQFKAFQECLQKHPEHVEGIMDDAEAQEDGEQTFEPQEATA